MGPLDLTWTVDIRSGVGRESWPAGVGAEPGGAMAGVGRRWPIGRFMALESKPIAPGRRGA